MRRRENMFKFYSKAQGLVEYSLILIFVAMAVIVVLAAFGPALGEVFSNIIAAI
jgi:pilus assembly protein Flp/PilA